MLSKNTTEAREEHDARERLTTVPGFTREVAESARFTRLIGMTNRVYRVDIDGRSVCLRIPGGGAAATIDRRAEQANARLADEAGVAPGVIYFAEDGLMLTHLVEGVPLRPERIRSSGGALERGAMALRRLHEANVTFVGTFQPFAKIDEYEATLRGFPIPLSELERNTIRGTQVIAEAFAACPVPLKPCHCDPTGRNLLDTGERIWLVDWEYSGMNDPMWDLAYFSIESLLDAAGDSALLSAYFGRAPEAAEAARLAIWKPVCEVQAALWALIQVAEGNPAGDFSRYAKASFERAAERIRAPGFAGQVGVLRGG